MKIPTSFIPKISWKVIKVCRQPTYHIYQSFPMTENDSSVTKSASPSLFNQVLTLNECCDWWIAIKWRWICLFYSSLYDHYSLVTTQIYRIKSLFSTLTFRKHKVSTVRLKYTIVLFVRVKKDTIVCTLLYPQNTKVITYPTTIHKHNNVLLFFYRTTLAFYKQYVFGFFAWTNLFNNCKWKLAYLLMNMKISFLFWQVLK